jgi:hypothetical protein
MLARIAYTTVVGKRSLGNDRFIVRSTHTTIPSQVIRIVQCQSRAHGKTPHTEGNCCLRMHVQYRLTVSAQFWLDVNAGFQLYAREIGIIKLLSRYFTKLLCSRRRQLLRRLRPHYGYVVVDKFDFAFCLSTTTYP